MDDGFLLREFDLVLKTDHGRRRVLTALPRIVLEHLDRADALRVLILRTMPYSQYLKTLHWRNTSLAAKERAGGRCQLCNRSDDLETHHRTYDRRGCEDPLDLTVLCSSCHERFHKEPPKPDEPLAVPALSDEQETAWLQQTVLEKRKQQGISPDGMDLLPLPTPLSQTLKPRRT